MRMLETATHEYTRQHLCGFPVRIRVDLTNIKLVQTKLSEMGLSYTGKVTYYLLNDNQPITYCPGCGRNFPKADEP